MSRREANRFRPSLEGCEDRTVPTPVVTIGWISDATEGGGGAIRAQLTRSEVDFSSLTVSVAYSGTATAGSDYPAQPSTVTFAPFAATVTIGFAATDDGASEPTETVVIGVQSGSGYTVGAAGSTSVNIFDNDAQYVSVEKIADATEGGTGTFRFTRIGDLSAVLSYAYSVSGSSTASSGDYTLPAGPLAFTAGSATSDLSVQAAADNLVEGDEALILSVTGGTGYSVGSPSSATVTIHDDPPVIQVTATDPTEGGSAGSFTFSRSGGKLSDALTVNYAVAGGAVEGDDYTALSGTVTFAANSSTASVVLTLTDDSTPEFDESVVLFILPDDGYTIGTNGEATAVIHDNDTPEISIQSTGDAIEGSSTGGFWLVRKGDTRGALTANFTVGGTATEGTDYTSIGTSVTFAAGEFIAPVTIDAGDDATSDPNETVILTLASGTGYTIDGSQNTATVKIIDAATPFITVEKIDDGTEGGTNGKFRFTRTGSTSSALTVYYSVSGDATSGSDYTALAGSVTIAAGNTTADVTVSITDDTEDEWTEFVTVAISPDSNYEIGDGGSAAVSITDNDPPEVTVAKVVDAAEDGGQGIFRFSRTLGELDQALTVYYTVGGSATSGTDYASLSGSVTFLANESTADVIVLPYADNLGEGTETVTVTISTNYAYTIGTASPASLDIREESVGSISGQFWTDTDGDATLDIDEAGLAYRSVFLMQGGEVIEEDITDTGGNYSFSGVTAGTYTLLFHVPGDFTPTTSADGTRTVTVTAATLTSCNEGAEPPANPAPTGKRAGIDWSTFDTTPTEVAALGVKGHLYHVKTYNGTVISLFAIHPHAVQTPAIRRAIQAGKVIEYDCGGYAFEMVDVVLPDGRRANFSPFGRDDIITAQYEPRSNAQAKADLAAGKKVIVSFVNARGSSVHVAAATKIVLNANGTLNRNLSLCNTKNGFDPLKLGDTIDTIDRIYANPVNGGAVGFVYYTLK